MNVLFMTLLYPKDQLDEVTHNAKDKLQNQINSYQHAFLEGIQCNLKKDETLSVLNALPVGIFPLQYRQLFLKHGKHDDAKIEQIGCINLPWLKQKGRAFAAERALRRWVKADPENRTVLLYTQYLPYMEAVLHVKKEVPELKAAVIVTDLPNEMGLDSGRTGIMKQIEYARGRRSLDLCRQMDGFILLTEPMAEAIGVKQKPHIIIEGLIQTKTNPSTEQSHTDPQTQAVLYTGTLEAALGIGELLKAFQQMPEYELWICGQGHMQEEVEKASRSHPNIRYFGFVPQKDALALQARATALINPRTPEGIFTRFSFPSKTLEYLRSGKPVLCYRLEGIPSDYDPYLFYINEPGESGIRFAVRKLMELPDEKRNELAINGRDYVLNQKNPSVQCSKLLKLLRSL